MAKIVPMVQLAAHAESSTLYGRTVVQPNFFGLMGYYYFGIVMGLRSASSAIRVCMGIFTTFLRNNKIRSNSQ